MANFNNNKLFEEDVPLNMINFEKGVRSTMENFKKCTEAINFDNSNFMKVMVQIVKEQREKFRKFAKDSIKVSNSLADYSIDSLFFIDCFKDDRYSNEDIIELLNDLLKKSKEIHRSFKELRDMIAKKGEIKEPEKMDAFLKGIKINGFEDIGIKEKLTEVNNYLSKYVEDIKKDPNIIDSDKKNKIEEETMKGKFYNQQSFMTFIAVLAVPVAAADLTMFGIFGGVINSMLAAGRKRMAIKQLNLERDELIEKVKLFTGSLELVISQIGIIDEFWVGQIERIDHLITNLRGFGGNKRCKQDLTVIKIEKQWREVENECKIYSSAIRNVLNSDVLLSAKN